ncbi:aspartic peptidase domain-containing protein [Xylogone sp. PMI_703]|nr:aspartic peptidase domain-containing protein [Xylogone sp. PMI_703]
MAIIVSFALWFSFITTALGNGHSDEIGIDPRVRPRSERKIIDVPVYADTKDLDLFLYFVNTTLGTSEQTESLWLDFTWGDTFIDTKYNCTASSSCTSNVGYFNQSIGPGEYVGGPYSRDLFKIDSANISIADFQFAQPTSSPKWTIFDQGRIGLGPLTNEGNFTDYQYPNFVQSLINEGLINSYAYSIYIDELNSSSGHLLLGGVNGDTLQTPLVTFDTAIQDFPLPLGYQSQITLQKLSITLENESPIQIGSNIPVILTSTYVTAFTANIYKPLLAAIGAINYNPDALPIDIWEQIQVPCSLQTNSSTIDFTFSNELEVKVPLRELIDLYELDDTDNTDACYFQFLVSSMSNGENNLGFDVMKRLVTVFDYTNMQISLGLNSFQPGSNNWVEIPLEGLSKMSIGPPSNSSKVPLRIGLGVGLGIGIPLFLLTCGFTWRVYSRKRKRQILDEYTGKGELPANGIRSNGADNVAVQNLYEVRELEATHGVSEAVTSHQDHGKLTHAVVELPVD